MTNKEAIERLKWVEKRISDITYSPESLEAIEISIKALEEKPQDDLIEAFELLKAHCKNRECNKDCVFYRELRVGDNTEQFCGLCEIVTSDDKGE